MTGASKGIGLAVTQALADEGVSVAAGAREANPELSQLSARSPLRLALADLSTPDGRHGWWKGRCERSAHSTSW